MPMKREIITISESGAVSVPTNVSMRDFEIAQLLGIMLPTVRGCIKRLLKSRMAIDCSGGEVSRSKVVPTQFGAEVVIAIAMQVNSYRADIFRKWLLRRLTQQQPIYIKLEQQRSNPIS